MIDAADYATLPPLLLMLLLMHYYTRLCCFRRHADIDAYFDDTPLFFA